MTTSIFQARSNIIEKIKIEEKMEGNFFLERHKIMYLLKGEATLTYDYNKTGVLKPQKLIFLSKGNHVNYNIQKNSEFIVFKIDNLIQLSEVYKANINKVVTLVKEKMPIIEATKTINTYMEMLNSLIDSGISNYEYFKVKIKELFLLIRMHYTDEEIAVLFSDSLQRDTFFTAYVWNNHHQYNSVKEFAKAMSYSVSGFEKRFKNVFGVSPYKWMKEQKAKLIYQEVCLGKSNFKEIAYKYNFASTSTFNDFYKLTFGETPGTTRKKHEQRKYLTNKYT